MQSGEGAEICTGLHSGCYNVFDGQRYGVQAASKPMSCIICWTRDVSGRDNIPPSEEYEH